MEFYIVDAFTDVRFGGNPAGVILLPDHSDFPDDSIMTRVAAELRYSETVFVRKLDYCRESNTYLYQMRYFTPTGEVDLCGHATIAASSVLANKLHEHPEVPSDLGKITSTKKNFTFDIQTKAGSITVNARDFITMDMAKPEMIGKVTDIDKLLKIFSITTDDLYPHLPPTIVSTGLPDIMLGVRSISILNNVQIDFNELAKLSERLSCTGVHLFTLDQLENDPANTVAHCRNFAPLYGIDEEAATGTSSGALAYYLHQMNEKIPDEGVFIQGEAMKRPSKIIYEIKKTCFNENMAPDSSTTPCDDLLIRVGGNAVILAQGEIHI